MLALVQIDRGDAAVGRLDERQALHRQTAAATFAAAAADRRGRRGRRGAVFGSRRLRR